MKVTRRGQVTIPKELRERTGMDEGTEVQFFEENGRLVIVKAVTENPFLEWVDAWARLITAVDTNFCLMFCCLIQATRRPASPSSVRLSRKALSR